MNPTTQAEKGARFRALHARSGAFVIPNPFDIGTARLLESLGFEALATTSAGAAFSLGRPDYAVDRDAMMAHVAGIARATDLPVSGDLGNGFGDEPEAAAETIRRAAAAGLVGGSIEDSTTRPEAPIYELAHAAERVRAVAEAARRLPFPFVLTARAENYLHGRPDLKDTIARLQAFQEAGADVLFAPGLSKREEVIAVVRSIDRPLNLIMGHAGPAFTVAELAEIGVKRISVGSSLARVALRAVMKAAREIREQGTFSYGAEGPSTRELNALFAGLPRARE